MGMGLASMHSVPTPSMHLSVPFVSPAKAFFQNNVLCCMLHSLSPTLNTQSKSICVDAWYNVTLSFMSCIYLTGSGFMVATLQFTAP